MSDIGRQVPLVLMAVWTLVVALILPAGVAEAVTCNRPTHENVVGGDIGNPPVYGFKAQIWANDFTGLPQCSTWRSIMVWQNGNNNVEIGWNKQASESATHTAFWYYVDAGIWYQHNVSVYPSNASWDTYWLANANGNDYWAFNINGSQVYSGYVPDMPYAANAFVNSERHDLQDSMWAHFQSESECTALNCASYHVPSYNAAYSNNSGGYLYCVISKSETYVKANC